MFMIRWLSVAGMLAALLSTGCGGGPGAEAAAPPQAAGKDCEAFFDPALLAQGEACQPRYGVHCPLLDDSAASGTGREIPYCEGVDIEEAEASAGRLGARYLVLSPHARQPSVVYLGLHWRNAGAERFVNLLRMQELVKARNVLVVVPNAPGLHVADVQSWPTSGQADQVEAHVALLDAVLDDVAERHDSDGLPLYVAGLSNGGIMTARYACACSDRVDAAMVVAGTLGVQELDLCRFEHPVGTVQVHGTQDPVVPYAGTLSTASVQAMFEKFVALNACGTERQTARSADGRLTIDYDGATVCSHGRRDYRVVVDGGGHSWPGMDMLYDLSPFGPLTRRFDATIQGFDLMTLAAGE